MVQQKRKRRRVAVQQRHVHRRRAVRGCMRHGAPQRVQHVRAVGDMRFVHRRRVRVPAHGRIERCVGGRVRARVCGGGVSFAAPWARGQISFAAHGDKPKAEALKLRQHLPPCTTDARGIHRAAQRHDAVHPVPRGVEVRLEKHTLLQRGRREDAHACGRIAERVGNLRGIRGSMRVHAGIPARGTRVRAVVRGGARGDERGKRVVADEVRGAHREPGVVQLRGELHRPHRVQPERGERDARGDLVRGHATERGETRAHRGGERMREHRAVRAHVRGRRAVARAERGLPRDEVERVVRGAHRAAVDLRARRARKRAQHDKVEGDEIRGEERLRARAQRARKRAGGRVRAHNVRGVRWRVRGVRRRVRVLQHAKGDDARRVARRARGHGDRVRVARGGGGGLHRGVDLEQLDAHAVDLHLVVVAPEILVLRVPEAAREVPRAVQAPEARVLHERRVRLRRVADVPARELWPADEELADRAARRDAPVAVQHDAEHRGERDAYVVRLHLVVRGERARRHGERRLRGPVYVHEAAVARPLVRDHLRELLPAVDQHAHRRHVRARQHGGHRRRHHRVRHVQRARDVRQTAEEQLERGEADGAAVPPRVEAVEDRQVKHVRGELQVSQLPRLWHRAARGGRHRDRQCAHPLDGRGVFDADGLGQPRCPARPDFEREVRGWAAGWGSRRAVWRFRRAAGGTLALVTVPCPVSGTLVPPVVCLRLPLHGHHDESRRDNIPVRRTSTRRNEDHARARLGEQRALARRRPRQVNRTPGGARLEDAEDGRIHVHALGHAHRDDLLAAGRADAVIPQERGDRTRARVQLRVCPRRHDGRAVPLQRDAALERRRVRDLVCAAHKLVLEPLAVHPPREVDREVRRVRVSETRERLVKLRLAGHILASAADRSQRGRPLPQLQVRGARDMDARRCQQGCGDVLLRRRMHHERKRHRRAAERRGSGRARRVRVHVRRIQHCARPPRCAARAAQLRAHAVQQRAAAADKCAIDVHSAVHMGAYHRKSPRGRSFRAGDAREVGIAPVVSEPRDAMRAELVARARAQPEPRDVWERRAVHCLSKLCGHTSGHTSALVHSSVAN
ncbi:hypothetical protein MSPP1_003210a, partial [Malassezia sp. CBS 17886]